MLELAPRSFQSLLAEGRFADAFAQGEAWLDRSPAHFDMRLFWLRAPASPKSLAALKILAAKKSRTPWPLFYDGLLNGSVEGLTQCERLAEFSASRYGWLACVLGRTFLVQNRFERAAFWLERSLEHKPFDWRALASLGEIRLCLGRENEARKFLDDAVAAAPEGREKGEALAWRGEVHLWRGRYRKALEDLECAVALDAPFAYGWRAAAVFKLGRRRKALRLLDEAAATGRADDEIFLWRAEAKRELGRHAEAVEDLNRLPGWMWARVNRALAFAALSDLPRMAEDFAALPPEVVRHVSAKIGLKGAPGGAPGKLRVLRAALKLSRGFRRNDYGQSVWMR